MVPSRMKTANFRVVAQWSEYKRDLECVTCKEELSQQRPFYVERQRYYVILLAKLGKKFKKFAYKF